MPNCQTIADNFSICSYYSLLCVKSLQIPTPPRHDQQSLLKRCFFSAITFKSIDIRRVICYNYKALMIFIAFGGIAQLG